MQPFTLSNKYGKSILIPFLIKKKSIFTSMWVKCQFLKSIKNLDNFEYIIKQSKERSNLTIRTILKIKLDLIVRKWWWRLLLSCNNTSNPLKKSINCTLIAPSITVKMELKYPAINLEKKCSNPFSSFPTLKKCSKSFKTKDLKIKTEKLPKINLLILKLQILNLYKNHSIKPTKNLKYKKFNPLKYYLNHSPNYHYLQKTSIKKKS